MTRAGATVEDDRAHMRAALALARRGLGATWPNPSVGCVIVRDGVVVGRGRTGAGGRPHAETEALAVAGAAARGATVYVTLEPCSHHGRTPPCAEALVAAGVARVVAACEDPDSRVAGRGFQRLREAGIAVDVGTGADEAWDLNLGFFLRVLHGRPMVTVKLATTLDGRIATHSGRSRWITGPVARAWGHGLRANHDAIMVGIGTALADDPELTCRLPGLENRSPIRIIVDSRLRLPLTARLLTGGGPPVWVVCREGCDRSRASVLASLGVEVITAPADPAGMPDLPRVLAALAERGLTRVLVEGGARLTASFLRTGNADRLEWFRAPSIAGGDGLPAAFPFGVDSVEGMPRFQRVGIRRAGDDLVESYRIES